MDAAGSLAPTEIKSIFARRRRRRFVVPGLAVIVWGAFLLITQGREPKEVLLVAFAAVAVFILGFKAWNWRCPACGGSLGRGLQTPRFCPNCGVALQ